MADLILMGRAAEEAERFIKRIRDAQAKLDSFKAGTGQQTRLEVNAEIRDLHQRLGELFCRHCRPVKVTRKPTTPVP